MSTPDTSARADIGVTGLATMGRNLARNFAHHGHVVAVHNRSRSKTDDLMSGFSDEGDFVPSVELEDFVASLKKPRTAVIMVKAGAPTDAVIDGLADLMEPGDIIVDGGNAHFLDTRRREAALRDRGLNFVGTGVSGGEEGALHGPSIMPGGSKEAYQTLGPLLEDISAKVDGEPCCTHIGPDGAGHFVKMVHNGIEYSDMQLIAEAYDLLRTVGRQEPAAIAAEFEEWNRGDLESYLIEITAAVLKHTDPDTGKPFVDIVVDRAEQKGTGRWTVQSALDLGIPVTGIAEATFARALSGHAEQREVTGSLPGPTDIPAAPDTFSEDVRTALYASKIVAYAQGFDQILAGSREYDWSVDPGAIASIWRDGCIIRARFLDRIKEAYEADPDLRTLMVAPAFASVLGDAQEAWRRVVSVATQAGVPIPGFASALSYYDALRRERLPAALIQGLRDYFGAHTYLRVDKPGVFHTLWAAESVHEVQTDAADSGEPVGHR